MSLENLSKTFKYVNENDDTVIFNTDNGFLINAPVGIDTLSVTLNEASGIGQTGTTVQSINVKSRPVTISGIVYGADVENRKNKLLSVIRPDLKGRLYADDYYLDVRPTATPAIGPERRFAHFQLSLLAPYPYWRRDLTIGVALSDVNPEFKFPWNISRPYRFGTAATAQFVEFNNSGQVPIPFTVTFSASSPVSTPSLIDAVTNKYLRVNKDMVTGERIVVEITHERTYVTSSVDGECRGALDLGSKLYRLAVGWNTLKPDAVSGRDNLSVLINYATEIVGVAL